MKKVLILSVLVFIGSCVIAQEKKENYVPHQPPIPVEVFAGQNSSMYQMIVSKQITPTSNFGFFNIINYEVDYSEFTPNSYVIQSVFDYQIIKGLKIGVGANLKAFGGFKPLIAVNYSVFSKDIGFLIQPSFELHKDGNAEVFSMFEWHPINQKKVQPYFRFQGLVSFNDKHSFSYHYWRAGLQYKMFRVGPALNVQYTGPKATSNANFGGFLTILIN